MSWNDDNTVPINDFNEDNETSLNVGLDDDDIEDLIPTSQPRSGQSFTSLESLPNKRIEETIPAEEFSAIEDTLPVSGNSETFSDSFDVDVIPNTGTKLKRNNDDTAGHLKPVCKKSLEIADNTQVKFSEDIFSTQASKVAGSPSIIGSQLLSVVNETATETSHIFSVNDESDGDTSKDILVSDASVTEIFDNDLSKETITVHSGQNLKISETQELDADGDKIKIGIENDLIDVDSPLRFLETSESLPVFNSQQVEDELQKSQDKISDGAMTNDTIDANGVDFPPLSPFPKRCDTDLAAISKLPSLSNGSSSSRETQFLSKTSSSGFKKTMFKNILSGELTSEGQKHSTPENHSSKIFNTDESASSIENLTPVTDENMKKMEFTFHLKVDCEILLDPQSKEIVSKKIVNVRTTDIEKNNFLKNFRELGTSSDDKSKRLSSSSAGSVYSDKTGFPFALPRLSLATRQTESSGSSNDELEKAYKISARKVWVNEYMVPMKMDEIFQRHQFKLRDMDDSNESSKRKTPLSSKKPKSRRKVPQRTLSDVTESTNTEDFLSNPDIALSDQSTGLTDKKKDFTQENLDSEINEGEESDERKNSERRSLETVLEEKSPEKKEEVVESTEDSSKENVVEDKTPEKGAVEESESEEDSDAESHVESDSETDELKIGTSVFARWTDLYYYSGTLYERPKVDRWNVKFDDNSTKVILEDFIFPFKWMKEGELVFALVDNNYEAGKITKVNRGKLREFTVELDETNLEVSVSRIDIRLPETYAAIVKEKYQPISKSTPKPKSIAEINFDNVLSGKRNREFSTPTRTPLQNESLRRSSANRESKTPARSSTKKIGTPVGSRSTGRIRKPKVSDETETSSIPDPDTPVRTVGKNKPKGKAKSLSSEFEKSETPAPALPVVPEEPVPGPSNAKRGRGRPPKLVKFEPEKDESSNKKTDNNQEAQEEEIKAPANVEVKKGKRKLKSAEVAGESKSEEENVTAKKKGKTSKKK